MTRESRRNAIVFFVVQMLSQSAFFAQGILSVEEFAGEPIQSSWFAMAVPLLYLAVQHFSGPCWRRMIGGNGSRLTTMVGAAIVATSVAVATLLRPLRGRVVYSTLAGVGTGLVRLWPEWAVSRLGNDFGVTGAGLVVWPLLACVVSGIHGPRYALLPLAGVALHAVPVARLLQAIPATSAGDESELKVLPDDRSIQDRPCESTYRPKETIEIVRVGPRQYVQVLPEIPEEDERDASRSGEATTPAASIDVENENFEGKHAGIRVMDPPFDRSTFLVATLLRLAESIGRCIIVSAVPIVSGYLVPHPRIQEKAFLVSLCGFSRLVAELYFLAHVGSSNPRKFVALGGPFLASLGLYLMWRSASLDAVTTASAIFGVGSGAAAVAQCSLVPGQSREAEDAVDFVVGIALLAMIPLVGKLTFHRAVQEYLLVGAGVYAAASIACLIVIRRVTR